MRSKRMLVLAALILSQALILQLCAQNALTAKAKQPLYRLVDMGTFGGPVSIVFGGTGNLNQMTTLATSCADTADLDPDWPNINPAFGNDPYIQHAFITRSGRLRDLGTLSGGTSSCGQGVNTRGVVAGFSTNGAIDPLTGFPEIEPVLWRNGKILDLGNFGGNGGYANFLNDRDQVVGGALNSIPDPFSSVLSVYGATQIHAFLWEDGAMEDLGTLGGPDSFAYYINERGEIAGQSFTNSVPNDTTGIPTMHPFLWSLGRMHDLGTLGGTIATPSFLNNRGQVAGTSNLAGDQASHPFFWDDGVMQDLGTFGGNNGEVQWMNDQGATVGRAYFPGDTRWDAFLWQDGKMTDLGNLGCTSSGLGINSKRQVVGTSRLADCATVHGWLWQDGKMYDLNDLITPGANLELVEPLYINDDGVIEGRGLPPGCNDVHVCGHAFLLFPCDGDDLRKCVNRLQVTTADTNLSVSPVPASSVPVNNPQPDRIQTSRNPLTQRGGFYQRGSRVD